MGDDSKGRAQCAKVLPHAEYVQHKTIDLPHARVMTTWEPSNGIVFASKTRPTARDRTWSPTKDIPFASTPPYKAHYATKRPPVKPSAATVRPARAVPAPMPYKAVNTTTRLARSPAPLAYTAPTKAAPASLGPNAKARAGPLNLASGPIDAEEIRRRIEEVKQQKLEEMKAEELAEEQKRKAEAEKQRLAEVARAARVVEITSDFRTKISQSKEAIEHIRQEYIAVEDEIQEATLGHRDALGLYFGRKPVLSPDFDALTRHKVNGVARRAREVKRELEKKRLEAERSAAEQERLASLPQLSPEVVKWAAWMEGVIELGTNFKAKREAEERAKGRQSYDLYQQVFEPLSPNIHAITKNLASLCETLQRQEDEYESLSKSMDSEIQGLATLRGSYPWAREAVELISKTTLVYAGIKLDFEEFRGWQRRYRELWETEKQNFQASLYDTKSAAHQSRRLTRQIRYHLDPVRGYRECWQTYNFDIALSVLNDNIKLSREDLRLAVDELKEWQPRTLPDRAKAYKPLFNCWERCEMFHLTGLKRWLINLVEVDGIADRIRLSWMADNAPLYEVERYRCIHPFYSLLYTTERILGLQRDLLTASRQRGSRLWDYALWRMADYELSNLAIAIKETRPKLDIAHEAIFTRAKWEDDMGLLQLRAADLRAFVRNRLTRVKKERQKEIMDNSRKVTDDRAATRSRILLAAREVVLSRRIRSRRQATVPPVVPRSVKSTRVFTMLPSTAHPVRRARRDKLRRVESSPSSAQTTAGQADTSSPSSKRSASSEVRRVKSLPSSIQSIASDNDTNPTPNSAKCTASQIETAPRPSNPKASNKARRVKLLPSSSQSTSTGNDISPSPSSTQSTAIDDDNSQLLSKRVASTNIRLKKPSPSSAQSNANDNNTSPSPSSSQSAASQNETNSGPSKRTAAKKAHRKKSSPKSTQPTSSENESPRLSSYTPLSFKPTSSKQAPHATMHGGSTSLGYAVEEGHCGDFTSEQQSDRGELYKSPDEGSGISEQESASDELYETASEGTESSGSEQASDEGSESESEATEEEHVPLSYQIPTEDLRKAMQASRSSGAAFWHYRLYRDPAGQAVRVHYCKNKEQTERVAALFADKSILGFDLEWKPNCFPRDGIKNSVSLIQIASEDRIALFHIAVHRGDTADELLAPALKQILESRAITKVGVNVRGDYARLRDVFGIDPQGYLELSHLYRVVKFSESQPEKVNKVLVALATQVEDHLQLPLSKGPVRASDWSKDLTMEQQQYAASDAYAGFRLFDVLEAKRKQLKPTPPRPAFHELNLPIRVPVRSVRVIPTRTAAQAQAQPPAAEDDSSDADSEDSDVAAVPSQVLTAETQNACFVPSEISLSPVTVESSENPHGPTQSSAVANASLTNRASRSEEKSPQQIPERPLEVKTAETWVQTWRASLPANYQPKASLTNLRAYSLWHCQALDVEIVAAKLRDPPLAMTTVSLYVLESVRMEGLPFDAGRLRSVLDILPQHVAQGRYRALWRKLQ